MGQVEPSRALVVEVRQRPLTSGSPQSRRLSARCGASEQCRCRGRGFHDIPRPRPIDRAGKLQHLGLRPLRRVQPTAAQIIQFLRTAAAIAAACSAQLAAAWGKSQNRCSACSASRSQRLEVAFPEASPRLRGHENVARPKENRRTSANTINWQSGRVGLSIRQNSRCFDTRAVPMNR